MARRIEINIVHVNYFDINTYMPKRHASLPFIPINWHEIATGAHITMFVRVWDPFYRKLHISSSGEVRRDYKMPKPNTYEVWQNQTKTWLVSVRDTHVIPIYISDWVELEL